MKTPEEALRRYVATLESISACVTNDRVIVRPFVSRFGKAHSVSLPIPGSLRALGGGRSGFRFDFRTVVALIGDGRESTAAWRIETQMYDYRFLDNDHTELLVYHWQPNSAGPAHPHLHVSASLDA